VPEYVAFMRAVNVTGHARVAMADLRAAFAVAGCRNVRTYIQSGNVVFDLPRRSMNTTLRRVDDRLRELLGEEPQFVVRTIDDVASLVDAVAFGGVAAGPRVKLYVAFLAGVPSRQPVFPLVSAKEGLEAVGIRHRDVFIVSRLKPSGFFGFPNNFVEEHLGVPATTRNLSTITKIVSFARTKAQV
jgi:uncharacterized protein (DUF1697 family)